MRQLTVVDAKREAAKARIALSGPPGAGKTWTALRIARTLSPEGAILFLDTEHESAKLYAPPFEFKHAAWAPPFDVKELTQAIYHYAAHIDVMIVDSLSHFWQGEGGVLDVASGKFTGWKEARPIQRAMVEAIVRAPCHFIGCMRSKIEYAQTAGKDGKQKVERLGQADIQSDEMPYEFTIAAELDLQHRLTITKTRCADLDGRSYEAHRETDMAATLLTWLNDGAEPAKAEPFLANAEGMKAAQKEASEVRNGSKLPEPVPDPDQQQQSGRDVLRELSLSANDAREALKSIAAAKADQFGEFDGITISACLSLRGEPLVKARRVWEAYQEAQKQPEAGS